MLGCCALAGGVVVWLGGRPGRAGGRAAAAQEATGWGRQGKGGQGARKRSAAAAEAHRRPLGQRRRQHDRVVDERGLVAVAPRRQHDLLAARGRQLALLFGGVGLEVKRPLERRRRGAGRRAGARAFLCVCVSEGGGDRAGGVSGRKERQRQRRLLPSLHLPPPPSPPASLLLPYVSPLPPPARTAAPRA